MMQARQAISPVSAVAVGMAGLAAAMGVGRFAFTPLMPLMQASGLSLAQGATLAAANYAGYLVGALACVVARPHPGAAARAGLAGVAPFTLAMGLTADFRWWLVWRGLAGVGSALVLIGLSDWTLQRLAHSGRSHWAGALFAGVGAGIALAGVASLCVAAQDAGPRWGWLLLGAAATIVLASTWRRLSPTGAAPVPGEPATRTIRFDADAWRLVVCYGVFGFGYIVPATFLPALARQLTSDPAIFGWTWPLFGTAAAASTVGASLALRGVRPRRVWAVAQLVMAAGVAAPAIAANAGTLLIAATAVGGTFMVITMAGIQEARRRAGRAAAHLIAAMTAAFAIGQLAGPVLVNALSTRADALGVSSVIAAALSALAAVALLLPARSPDTDPAS